MSGAGLLEMAAKIAFALLALTHAAPAAVAFAPSLVQRLYKVAPNGDLGVLIAHRGFLFFAILAGCVWAMFDPPARRAVGVIVAISLIGFLTLYVQAGAPKGALRTIAAVDTVALAPLAVALVLAFRG